MRNFDSIVQKIRQKLKDKQFERDVRNTKQKILSPLRYCHKIKGKNYNDDEKKEILKSMKNAEKILDDLFKKHFQKYGL